jgi:hypothetical protein
MANPEHVKLLKRSVKEWNKWRSENPEIWPDLIGGDLRSADLRSADLSSANLRNAALWFVNFSRTKLQNADFTKAQIVETVFARAYLNAAKGLDTVLHVGPSYISTDTLYKSGGNIPESFLRGCGIPDDFIAFIPSHFGLQQAIQFYSCFISYSTKDEEFARRLYSRMCDEKLRVWFAPEEMKGGKKLYDQIEQAIQLHDRLLIVLSENSLNSKWVRARYPSLRRSPDE